MIGRRCARCPRTEPPGEDDAAQRSPRRGQEVDPAEAPFLALLGGAWGSVNGEDICPQCQTAAERADLARGMISAIEAEIFRSAERDPSPVEPGLVTFAMQLREAVESYEKSTSAHRGQDEPEDLGPVPSRTRIDVAITGAFLTGCPLRVGIDNYAAVQHALATKLTENADQGWLPRTHELREGSYDSGGGFSDEVPLVLACRDGLDTLKRAKEILSDRPKREHDWLAHHAKGWTFRPTSMRIEVYDLGVAVIDGTFEVDMQTEVTLDAAAVTMKRVVWLRPDDMNAVELEDPQDPVDRRAVSSPITEMFRQLTEETTSQFRASLDATKITRLEPWLPNTDEGGARSREWGRLLWLHPVHLLEIDDATDKASAEALAPTFSKTIKVPKGSFVSGVGWSAIVTLEKSAYALPLKLVHLHWAYFALYMEIDRGLLMVLDKRNVGTKGTTLSELETDAVKVFKDYLRVMKARARVDSALASLGGDEQAIWDVIADVQKFKPLVRGVDRKVDVLQGIADRRVQQATAASSKRSTRILGLLTMLTLVTLATTLLVYFLGGIADDPPDQHVGLRIGILITGAAVAFGLWFVTFLPHPGRTWKQWKASRAEPHDESQ